MLLTLLLLAPYIDGSGGGVDPNPRWFWLFSGVVAAADKCERDESAAPSRPPSMPYEVGESPPQVLVPPGEDTLLPLTMLLCEALPLAPSLSTQLFRSPPCSLFAPAPLPQSLPPSSDAAGG